MLLDDSVIYDRVVKTFRGTRPVFWNFNAEILIGDKVVPAGDVLELIRSGSWAGQAMEDNIVITTTFPLSTFRTLIEPNRNNLRLRLTKTLLGDQERIIESSVSRSKTFKAHLSVTTSPSITMASDSDSGTTREDINSNVRIDFQLTELGLDEFASFELAGVFRGDRIPLNMNTILQGLFSQPLKSLGGKSLSVEMFNASNDTDYRTVVIPNGIKLPDLPEYLQNKYGVYSSGISRYFRNGCWYIFPTRDYTRFAKEKKTLTILGLPAKDISSSEASYVEEGDNLFVVAMDGINHSDSSEVFLQNIGNGYRYTKASHLIDLFFKQDKGVPVITAGRNRVSKAVEKRPDGLNNFIIDKTLQTDNPYRLSSIVTEGLASTISVLWENSNTNLLYPGMPVKILYMVAGTLRSIYGTLLGEHSVTKKAQNSPTDIRYVTNTKLLIHARRENK